MATIPFSSTAANLAFPLITKHFSGTSRATISWMLTGNSIVVAALMLVAGQLSDRLGAFRMLTIGLVGSVACNVVATFASTPLVLIAARSLFGVASALVLPSSLAVALLRCPPDRRTFTVGLWTATFPLASCVTPVGSALMLDALGWRGAFASTAVLSAVALGLAGLLVRRAPLAAAAVSRLPGKPDLVGMVVGTMSVGLAVLALVKGSGWGWTSGPLLVTAAASLVLAPLFVDRCRRHRQPLVDPSLFRIRTYSVASKANLLIALVGSTTWLLWPLLMGGIWHYKSLAVGAAITPTPFCGALSTILLARRAQARGYGIFMIVGSVLLALGCAWFAIFVTVKPNYLFGMVPGLLITGVGIGLTFSPLNAWALTDVAQDRVGQANAAFATGRTLSGALGIAAAIAVLDTSSSDPLRPFDRAFVGLAVAALLAGMLLLLERRERPARRAEIPMTGAPSGA